jgi:hypothetical protein
MPSSTLGELAAGPREHRQREHADRLAASHERRHDRRTQAETFELGILELHVRQQVGDELGATGGHRGLRELPGSRRDRCFTQRTGEGRALGIDRHPRHPPQTGGLHHDDQTRIGERRNEHARELVRRLVGVERLADELTDLGQERETFLHVATAI